MELNKNLKNLIKHKLSCNYLLYGEYAMKLCSFFYNQFMNENGKIPTVEFYDNYVYKSDLLKKIFMISFIPDENYVLDEEFRDYEIKNGQNYYHYGFDKVNNVFYLEKRFYMIYDLLYSNRFSKKIDKFLNFINIFVAYYDEEYCTFHVSKNFSIDEIFNNKSFRRNNISEKFSIERNSIPKWLYCSPPEELNIDNYIILRNADVKSEFIKKAGIDKLLSLGKIVDSYENYPDNEWWAKSEYKLIDMHKVVPPQKIYYEWSQTVKLKPCKYAPFLYMKNQTTGVIHLEGIHPSCRNLYDALKMRYNGLNLPTFDIKDIK